MSIQEKQKQVVQEFAAFENWEDKYKKVIQLGKTLEPLDDSYKVEKYRIKGCQSQVWLMAELNDGRVVYKADSDAVIVKGLAALLISVFSGHTPQEIAESSVSFLQDIGLTSHLSQSRANGLASMVKQFKNYALAFQVLQAQKS